ncbi:MAG: alkaline phosphatase family protein [Vicinamibacteria bacterium]|nr:alkaline phosphatase family protein [Vicinamibacteria bacterium]
METKTEPLATVDAVRDELRRLGYLDSGLDRFVLSGANAPSPARALLGVIGLLAWLGGSIAAWIGRRSGRHPSHDLCRRIGLAMGVLCLAYLAFWFHSHALSAPFFVQLLVLALGIALSLIVDRFVTLAAVAVLAAGGSGESLPEARLARHHVLPVLIAVALILGAIVVTATYIREREGPHPPPLAIVATPVRVSVLAVDGLEWRLAERLLAHGMLPNLSAMLAESAHGRLTAEPQRVPAIVWTTIATGMGPERHGIAAPDERRLAGMRTPVSDGPFGAALTNAGELLRLTRRQPPSSVLRGGKTIWNVASDAGLAVGVVNWWATWPVETVNGYEISERTFFKLDQGAPSDRDVHPADIYASLRGAVPPKTQADTGDPMAMGRRIDAFCMQSRALLRSRYPTALDATYLPGLDIATSHLFEVTGISDLAAIEEHVEQAKAAHRALDVWIGQFRAQRRADEILVLIGDPGRFARRSPRAEGCLILAGSSIRKGPIGTVSARDIAPTILYLLGLPVSRELPGRVVSAAIDESFRTAYPLRQVDSYGRRGQVRPADSAYDHEMIENLRSLGYVQ